MPLKDEGVDQSKVDGSVQAQQGVHILAKKLRLILSPSRKNMHRYWSEEVGVSRYLPWLLLYGGARVCPQKKFNIARFVYSLPPREDCGTWPTGIVPNF